MLNKYELVEFNILKYLHKKGWIWTQIGSTSQWNERFKCETYMELPAIIFDIYENEYFDLPVEYNNFRIMLAKYHNSNMIDYNTVREKLAKLLNHGIEVLITAKGISYLRELEEKMSKKENQHQVIQQFFAPVKNVTGTGDIQNIEIVFEKFFNNLIERIPDLPDERKADIKKSLPEKVKNLAMNLSVPAFSLFLNWLTAKIQSGSN